MRSYYIQQNIKPHFLLYVGHNDTLRISSLFIKHQLDAIVRLAIELSRLQ